MTRYNFFIHHPQGIGALLVILLPVAVVNVTSNSCSFVISN